MSDYVGPFPLVVGISGHRDIVDEAIAPVRATLRRVLLGLQRAYPHTPIQLVSALADGADQLAAEEALALGLSLAAVLPMALDDYEQTLATTAARQRLRELWHRAELHIELPGIESAPLCLSPALQYEHAGLVIANSSHVMLVLWNGLETWDPDAPAPARHDRQGGTAHIAYLRARGESESAVLGHSPIFPSVHTMLHPLDHGLTFRIAAPRRKMSGCVGLAGSLWLLSGADAGTPLGGDDAIGAGAEAAADQWDAPARRAVKRGETDPRQMAKVELGELDKANAMLAQISQKNIAALARSAERLLPDRVLATLDTQRMAGARIRHAYACADIFSQANQRYTYRAIWGIVLALPAAVLSYELYAHVMHGPAMLLTYLLVIAIPALAYRFFIRRLEWQNHFQDFRALAEALRVQFFWGLAGVPCAVTDFYLRKHHDEMSWIRQALRGPALQALAMGLGPAHAELIKTHWVGDQFGYFSGTGQHRKKRAGKAEQNRQMHERCEVMANVAYGIGVCSAFALLVLAMITSSPIDHRLKEFLIILMGLAPAIAGALSIIAEKRAYKDHAHQYSRMGRIFGDAAALIARADGDRGHQLAAIIRDLGAEALAENGDWLLAHRDRRVEPIKGG